MIPQISREDYRRVKEILADALEIDFSKRLEFVKTKCGDREDLRIEIESLLAERTENNEFLEIASAVAMLQKSISNTDSFLGQRIDNYRVVKEIGRGGMGVVFLAEREDFHQQVAVKLIKRGMDSDAILERFAREREILAALNHPFIARLTDGGTAENDLPFFVMEYVEGASINEYCKTNHLTEKEILELFRKVCEAVSFAHQKLIVHRDLKPSNILVTADGTPKLLDFGIAKLLNTTEGRETQTNQRALTPAYASPEQIRGEQVDMTSDVYSLGKILSELLQADVKSEATAKTAEGYEQEESTNNPRVLLSTDLQAILQTSLREDRARRYYSVERFADDVRRYQSGLPVSAQQDTFAYRTKKFIQRNLVAVALACLLILSLIIGLMVEVWQFRETSRERTLAQQRFNDVRELADSFMFEFHDAIENLPGSTPARKLVVERALQYLNKLDHESVNDNSLQRELATAYERIGKIQGNSYFSNLGDTDGAMKSYSRSLEIRLKLAAAAPDNIEIQKELSDSFEGVGDMLYTVGNLENGLQNYQSSLALREIIAGSAPDKLEYLALLGDIYGKIGDIEGIDGYPNLGDTRAALEYYQKAVEVDGKILEVAPDKSVYKVNYAQKLTQLGSLYRTVGKIQESINSCRKADKTYQTLIASDPNRFSFKFNMLFNNATLRYSLVDNEEYDAAVGLMQQTITTLGEMQTADPQNNIVRRSLEVSYTGLSRTLARKGEYIRAIESDRQGLKLAEELAQSDPNSSEKSEDLANALRFLADAQFDNKNYSDSTTNYKQAIEISRKNLEHSSTDTRIREDLTAELAGLGKTAAATGNFDEAVKNYNELIPIIEEISRKSPVNAIFRSRLALRYLEFGEIYQHLSEKSSADHQTNLSQAKELFQKSNIIWNQMQQEGILNKADVRNLQKSEKDKTDL